MNTSLCNTCGKETCPSKKSDNVVLCRYCMDYIETKPLRKEAKKLELCILVWNTARSMAVVAQRLLSLEVVPTYLDSEETPHFEVQIRSIGDETSYPFDTFTSEEEAVAFIKNINKQVAKGHTKETLKKTSGS